MPISIYKVDKDRKNTGEINPEKHKATTKRR